MEIPFLLIVEKGLFLQLPNPIYTLFWILKFGIWILE